MNECGSTSDLPGIDPELRRFNELIETAAPGIRTLLDLWLEARDGKLVPNRRDIDPISVPKLLPSMWVYRWDDAQDDFICKLAGESLRLAWGHSIAGMTLREIVADDDYPTVRPRWRRIVSVPVVHFGSAEERLRQPDRMRAERLILPLSNDDETIDHVLGLSLYKFDSRREERSPLMSEDIVQVPCANL